MVSTGQDIDDLPPRPRVLLVDDDEVNLLLTAAALRERGFEVTESPSGTDALAKLSVRAPDVVVLDALMPELDGFETCALLRATPGVRGTARALLDGPGPRSLRRLAAELGARPVALPADAAPLLFNANTPADWAKVIDETAA